MDRLARSDTLPEIDGTLGASTRYREPPTRPDAPRDTEVPTP